MVTIEKKEFIAFLNRHGVYDTFEHDRKAPKSGRSIAIREMTFDEFWEYAIKSDPNISMVIPLAFDTSDSSQGQAFWNKIHREWYIWVRFKQIMDERGYYENLCTNLFHMRGKTIDEHMEEEKAPWWIINAFEWEKTPQGYDYWQRASNQWRVGN